MNAAGKALTSHLVVGILLQQPLPDIPSFDMYLDHLGTEHEEVAKCELISGGSVSLTDGARCCWQMTQLNPVWCRKRCKYARVGLWLPPKAGSCAMLQVYTIKHQLVRLGRK